MARQIRFRVPGIPQHVVVRGNNRKACFFLDDDRRVFLCCLAEALQNTRCLLHAYVLMTNHVHFLVTPSTEDGIPTLMQSLGRRYVRHVNARHGRTGTLWEGRYKATVVDCDAHLLAVYRYIELNPVRAAMVRSPAAYLWSSHAENASGQPRFPVCAHGAYTALAPTAAARAIAYRGLFEHALTKAELESIRVCTQRGWPLGSRCFERQLEDLTGRCVVRNGWGGSRTRHPTAPQSTQGTQGTQGVRSLVPARPGDHSADDLP